jgi:hypothetical protein
MQAVRKQGHGAVGKARRDFDDHHCGGDGYYPERTAFTGSDLVLPENMLMLPAMYGFIVHIGQ